jgi:hypothetical protein
MLLMLKQTNNPNSTIMPIFQKLKQLSDSFFDGLKSNAINAAVERGKSNKTPTPPIIKRMAELDKLAKELEKDLEYYDPDYDPSENK